MSRNQRSGVRDGKIYSQGSVLSTKIILTLTTIQRNPNVVIPRDEAVKVEKHGRCFRFSTGLL
jgi:hypothetical protein